MSQIAIIDDDIYIGDMLEEALRKEGYETLRAYSGTEALMLLSSRRPDLVLLDLMLPGLSGEKVLQRIRGVPVIVLSAKAQVEDKVSLLLGGAADYMTKPFALSELLARIAVQLRTSRGGGEWDVLTFDNLRMDTNLHQVTVNGSPVHLTKTEYAVLKLLLLNPGRVHTKSQILDGISEDTPDCVESSLKVHMSNLRRKLREQGGREYIESVWGIGFKMASLKES